MFSEPVFATSIPIILKWGKNTKSTKTSLLIDYLWEQQAILKRKRIKRKTWIHINLKVFLRIWKSPGWMITFPNSSRQFQTTFSSATIVPISCTMFTYVRFACSATFSKYRRYLTIVDDSVFLVLAASTSGKLSFWLLSSFRQPPWKDKLMWPDCKESNLINKVLRPEEGQCLRGVHTLQRYVHTWQTWYNLVVCYCVRVDSICLS